MGNVKDFVALETKKLNINDIIESVGSPNCGAVSTFIGTTRDNFEQKKVIKLEYEAYEPMAIKEMQAVCNKVRLRWDIEKIAIYHRLGEVPVKEASIVIAISSSHRQESLQAVQFAIDTVKASVPIWKKEIYENEEPQWKENKECPWSKNVTKIKLEKTDNVKEGYFSEMNNVEIDLNNVYETVEINSENINENSNDQYYSDNDNNENIIIDPEQIQIKASAEELKRRIESFISRKREEVNILNVQGFYPSSNDIQDDTDGTCICARVNAILSKHHETKTHIKVHRVENRWSQQNIKGHTSPKNENKSYNYPYALEERFSSTEKILGINKPVPRDVYERIKKIEDRLLFLEGISPEYKDLWNIDDCDSDNSLDLKINEKPIRKRTHSSAELDSINELENRHSKIAK